MDKDFWLERWTDGRTNFHQNRVTPLLQKYWPTLSIPRDARVLVPLCGKSLDMVWLASQGYNVLGVELSPLAIQQFVEENQLHVTTHQSHMGEHTVAGNIELICGDIFDLDRNTLTSCVAVYDRAALIALPPEMRQRYVDHVYGQLQPAYQGVLITLDYDQSLMNGPPFSVPDVEVQQLFKGHSQAHLVDRRDTLAKEPRFLERGLPRLDTRVYRVNGIQQ